MKRGEVKSQNKGEVIKLTKLLRFILEDVSLASGVCLQRDIVTVTNRLRDEGLPFSTKTLPAFGKALDASFQTGKFQPPSSFKRKGGSLLPAFLHGLTSLVFDDQGYLLDQPVDPTIIWAIRQICFFLYKYELPYKKEDERVRIQKFMDVEEELPDRYPFTYDPQMELFDNSRKQVLSNTLMFASMLNDEIFHDWNEKDIVPRHGPGSTSTGSLPQYAKYNFGSLGDETEDNYPTLEYFNFSPENGAAGLGAGSATHALQSVPVSRTARAVLVPKDSRGPRLIYAEPYELQWLQQGLRLSLQEVLESHPLTKGRVNFADQSINGKLALLGSNSNNSELRRYCGVSKIATLDMEDASDRVSLALVRAVLPIRLTRALERTRSTHVKLPAGLGGPSHMKIKKVSPMGSGVCFPVESITFYSLCVGYIRSVTALSLDEACAKVWVYGDDIIVAREYATGIMETLEYYGLKFNQAKSFLGGLFRESCGVDAYNGQDVTPIRLKQRLPHDRKDANAVVGWVATSNLLHKSGLWRSANYMASLCRKILGGILPVVPDESGAIGLYSFCGDTDLKDGWAPERQPRKMVVKAEGPGWTMLKPNSAMYLQGKTLKVWHSVITTEKPSLTLFTGCERELHWAAYHAGRSEVPIDPTTGIDLTNLPEWDGRSFSRRYSNKLRQKMLILT